MKYPILHVVLTGLYPNVHWIGILYETIAVYDLVEEVRFHKHFKKNGRMQLLQGRYDSGRKAKSVLFDMVINFEDHTGGTFNHSISVNMFI